MKKNWFKALAPALALSLALCLVALGGCMNTDNRATATTEPTAQATAQPLTGNAGAVGANPQASTSPDANASATTEAKSSFNWAKETSRATDELNRITEINQSYVVVDGDDAIVGLTFDSNYKGGLTERVISMVRQKLVTLDPALEDVEVTAEPDQVKRIQSLSERLASGATIDQLESEFETIYDQIKNARKSAS